MCNVQNKVLIRGLVIESLRAAFWEGFCCSLSAHNHISTDGTTNFVLNPSSSCSELQKAGVEEQAARSKEQGARSKEQGAGEIPTLGPRNRVWLAAGRSERVVGSPSPELGGPLGCGGGLGFSRCTHHSGRCVLFPWDTWDAWEEMGLMGLMGLMGGDGRR